MTEELAGRGTLKPCGHLGLGIAVEYQFTISTRLRSFGGGLPSITAHNSSSGLVRALDGQQIENGIYELEAADGEILRVKNLGTWHILSSAA